MNIPYEMFLTIQLMHLTCRKDHVHNVSIHRVREAKEE